MAVRELEPVAAQAASSLVRRWETAPTAHRRGRLDERAVVLLLSATTYLSLSVWLILLRHAIFGDALSRVGNAQYVIDSRDPHLAAVGFVWNPLPSLLMVPLIPLRWVWPQLVSTGFLAGVESALFMAGAVVLVRGILADLGVGRLLRLTLTAAFALHPMIAIYAYNGMSEAPLLFFTLLASRCLLAWERDRTTRPLVLTGVALALGYLTRYEAMASGAAVIVLVAGLSFLRAEGTFLERRRTALTDASIVGLPFLFAFASWAVLSKVIVREWFPTISSQYGNSAQVGSNRTGILSVIGQTPGARLSYVSHQALGLEPLFVVVLALALLLALVRRSAQALVPLAVGGAVVAFDVLAAVDAKSFGWLRFQIVEIPLAFVLAGIVVVQCGRPRIARGVAGVVALALLAPAFLTTVTTLQDRRLAREETQVLRGVLSPGTATETERSDHTRFGLGTTIAQDIGYLPGPILTDAAYAFPILLATEHPHAFVITPDQDFERALADPVTFHIRYLLVPDPSRAAADALDVAYPDLYAHGWPGGTLVQTWAGLGGGASWRLYELPETSP